MKRKTCLGLTASLLFLAGGCAHLPADDSVQQAANTAVNESSRIGDHYLKSGELDKALYFYQKAASAERDDPNLYYKIGYVHDRNGDLKSANKAYGEVLSRNPAHAGALESRGTILLKLRDYAAAATSLTRAIDADPGRIKARNGLGIIADLNGDHALAVGHYQAALNLQPNSVRTSVNLGYSYYLAGAWDDAERVFGTALELDPDNALANQNLGLLYARQGRYAEAIKQLSGIMSEADAYNDVGYVCMLDNKHRDAARFLAEAVRRSPAYNEIAQKNLVLNRELASRRVPAPASQPLQPMPTPAMNSRAVDRNKSAAPTKLRKQYDRVDSPQNIIDAGKTVQTELSEAEARPDQRHALYLRRFVATPVLRVRDQAGLQSIVLDRVNRGRVVRVLRQDKEWSFVKYWEHNQGSVHEKTGWVNSQYLSETRYPLEG